MWTDSLGNPLTLQGAASLPALNDFVEGFIASEARAADILAAAQHDGSPMVQGYAAAVHMFAESADAPGNARPFIERALAGADRCTQREQRFLQAVKAWVDGDIGKAIVLHEEQAREHPRDLASIKLGHYHLFNRGDSPGMLRMALAALSAAGDVAYLHGMLAFAWEQCHALQEAEAAARKAIAMCRKEPWAHHALAHVMLTQGRLSEGHAFLQEVSSTWTDLNSFMVTHNWWHQALFALELDRHDEVLALYDQQVWGVAKAYSQDQINAVSLLARLELAGVDVGERWVDLGQYLAERTGDQVLPFLDMQYLYGLARSGRPEAQALLHNIEARAREDVEGAWNQVCLPASRGLLAHAEGDMAAAVKELGSALPRMLEIGGSHAQRDLFAQVHLDAMVRSGHLGGAQNILQQQVRAQPESRRLRRQAAALYASLGLSSVTTSFF
ncbi:tetratricopeptide repeat protein [uncultured Ramlibacter sp.]|uniref:tetratricopeptide repeat protein n=1 Tax=uncultured Ramlibacter sp. TaxID=260755 RepID=UPI0026313A24|nr:tetratricopeptide repeat protein [uncultured Ramlibacter sp.]